MSEISPVLFYLFLLFLSTLHLVCCFGIWMLPGKAVDNNEDNDNIAEEEEENNIEDTDNEEDTDNKEGTDSK